MESTAEKVQEVVDKVKNVAIANNKPKGEKKVKKAKEASSDRPLELSPSPEYIESRIQLFEKLKAEYDAEVAAKPREDITISLPDGNVRLGKSWETSPADIARGISKSLFEKTVIALVDGQLWDLERPLEGSCRLELLDFNHPEGKKVFWHSSAHVLGESCEKRFGCHLTYGPPTDEGFFYDMAIPDGEPVKAEDLKPLETLAQKAIKEKQKFERLEVSKENLLEMFKYSKYKQHFIETKVPDGEKTTVYRNGPLIDLCVGPHVPHTGRITAFKVMKNSASYWQGDANSDSLQRIYGVSFPDKKLMTEHLAMLEEAAKRDHRKIGKEQELFFFHELSPGSCFFLPHGARIYNVLMEFLREEYWARGYEEVMTPNMYNTKLWETSGHWQNYQENMFAFDVEKDKFGLKPMNCPGHCLLFAHRERSYRELPWRVADFGVLHRNEFSGALTGLTRVRRFQQDDSHIFCTEEQVKSEIHGLFDFLKKVYGLLGFTFKLKLSTRPEEKYVGDIETWNKAEAQLQEALEEFTAKGNSQWELNPGDGAFYGPKIDITISDALKRDHQCATIQLDFQLPQRFKLEYQTGEAPKKAEDGAGEEHHYKRPVMIHRAIYGSFERFIGILTEHFAGKWPFWLSPRQIMIIPVMVGASDYCLEVQKMFRAKGMHVDVDLSGNTMNKKIRAAQLQQYNYIFVLGAQEKESRAINMRNRDDPSSQQRGEVVPLDEALEKFCKLKSERRLENKL
ncbi:threonyl-tRNA synthetase-like protein [Sphaerosporella brunnea]|uniref:Threonine--tRNA ligase, cytoplasmic n=1 Tax=Sphaerosporella brunnea TaxID=1250544 RepID=A0A5J5F2Y6_9PEZI|nr:threonyl-tRNA synthetase-like protein [Sphaerosporella brunnea]